MHESAPVLPEFYNMMLERHEDDELGYGFLFYFFLNFNSFFFLLLLFFFFGRKTRFTMPIIFVIIKRVGGPLLRHICMTLSRPLFLLVFSPTTPLYENFFFFRAPARIMYDGFIKKKNTKNK